MVMEVVAFVVVVVVVFGVGVGFVRFAGVVGVEVVGFYLELEFYGGVFQF